MKYLLDPNMATRFFTRLKCAPTSTKYISRKRCLTFLETVNRNDANATENILRHCHSRFFGVSSCKRVSPALVHSTSTTTSTSSSLAKKKRGCIRHAQVHEHTKTSDCKKIARCYSNGPVDNIEFGQTEAHMQDKLSDLSKSIKQELNTSVTPLRDVSHYYFDGQGKYIRPMLILMMAATCNQHTHSSRAVLPSQETVAMVCEMIHTASLVHDDVIDGAETRRGKLSVNKMFGDKYCILAGDYILSCASQALAKLGNAEIVKLLAEVVEDLVRGEFMQLGSKEDPNERFAHYLKKTYKKTASLIACCCKAVAVFGESSPEVQEIAYQYGKNVGMSFQLVDDVLDFVASESEMGKPTAADLKLGLATAPVLFACEKFPELNALVMRRFKEPGDVEKAWDAVYKSDGISRTYDLANQYAKEAIRQINKLTISAEQQAIINITRKVLSRRK